PVGVEEEIVARLDAEIHVADPDPVCHGGQRRPGLQQRGGAQKKSGEGGRGAKPLHGGHLLAASLLLTLAYQRPSRDANRIPRFARRGGSRHRPAGARRGSANGWSRPTHGGRASARRHRSWSWAGSAHRSRGWPASPPRRHRDPQRPAPRPGYARDRRLPCRGQWTVRDDPPPRAARGPRVPRHRSRPPPLVDELIARTYHAIVSSEVSDEPKDL